MKKLTTAELEKEIKELRRDLEDTEDRRRSGEGRGDNLRAELDAAQHELVHFKQTVRSLHYALNVVTAQLAVKQKGAGRFATASRDGDEWVVEKTAVWGKPSDTLALAE